MASTIAGWLWWELWHIEDVSWLLAEASSPSGERIARLWCPDRCDVSEFFALTVSPAERDVDKEPAVEGSPPEGMMPREDVVLRGNIVRRNAAMAEDRTPKLRWKKKDHLVVDGLCLAASGGGRLGSRSLPGLAVTVIDRAPASWCRFDG